MSNEVLPYVDDAWVDNKKTKIGYEVPFSRFFYTAPQWRSLEEIDQDLRTAVASLSVMLKEMAE